MRKDVPMRSKSLCALLSALLALMLAYGIPAHASAEQQEQDVAVEEAQAPETEAAQPEGEGATAQDDAQQPIEPQDVTAPGEATVVEEDASDEIEAQATYAAQQAALDAFAAEHANDLPAGRYSIHTRAPAKSSANSGVTYALDVRGNSKNNGAEIILYTKGSKDNQRFDVEYVDGGYAMIKSVSSGLYLSVDGGDDAYSSTSAAKLVQHARVAGAKWQQWVICRLSDGSYTLTSAMLMTGERRLVDVKGGKAANTGSVILYKDTSKNGTYAGNQRWTFALTEASLDADAAAHVDDLAKGTYMLGSAADSNLVLNVKRASTANGASIILYANEGTLNETWDVTIDSNGYATITSTLSGKVLDVRGGKAGNGAEVIQYAKKSTNARNQQWIAIKEAGGSYKFVSALLGDTRYVLGVKGGTAKSSASLCLQPDGGASNKAQHFVTLDPPEQMAYRNALADGTYMFRSMLDATFCLDVSGNSKIEGAQVKLWTGKRSNNQLWQVSHDKNGFVLLKNKNSGKYLAFSAGAVGDSIVTVQSSTAGKWIAIPSGDAYILKDSKSGKCIEVSGSAANGAKTIAASASTATSQKWTVAPIVKIAIDPGHGGNDSGATGNGLRECDLTWKVAQACVAELKAHGVDVYLTVGENEFKHGSTVSIRDRVQRAYNAGCTAVISIHINAGGGNGAVVLVPNSAAYHHEFYTMGQSFAKDVIARINKLGIARWGDGAWERNYSRADGAEKNLYYESKASRGYQDYYGIVRYARLHGMFGVIIEHGFIDNAHDAKILRQSAAQTALGKADAAAIIGLYN